VIGQPLDLQFDLSLDNEGEASAACPQAEVFYGETGVDPSRVRLVVSPGNRPAQAQVRLLSSVAVNEPFVSIVLRAGCGQSLSRRYVLLASAPVAADARQAASVSQAASVGALPVAPAPTASAGAATSRSMDESAANARPKPAARPAVSTATPSTRRAKPAPGAAKAAEPGRPRLELQSPLDWLEEHDVRLRPSMEMAKPAEVTPEQRAAAAATWRSLGMEAPAVPAEAPGTAERLQALEAELKTLQAKEARERNRTAVLQGQLDEAESDRRTYWLVTAVLALLALALGALSARWWRLRGDGHRPVWWKRRHLAPEDSESGLPSQWADDVAPPSAAAVMPPPPVVARPPMAPVAVAAATEAAWQDPPARAFPSPAVTAVAVAGADVLPASDVDDAEVDAQQNAEFYVSLGQYEQAISLLQRYIAARPGTSPAVYLDLLKILHTLSLTDDYRKLREEFNAIFNAEVPAFAGFLKSVRRLEDYPDALNAIQSRWRQPEVLEVIDAYLYRSGGPVQPVPFELEAYRELLLLRMIAQFLHGQPGARGIRPSVAGVPPAAALQMDVPPARVPVPEGYRPSFPLASLHQGDIGDAAAGSATTEPLAFDLSLDDPADVVPPAPPDPAATNKDAIGFAPAPPTDSNLIDFDLFDVDAPPLAGGKRADDKV